MWIPPLWSCSKITYRVLRKQLHIQLKTILASICNCFCNFLYYKKSLRVGNCNPEEPPDYKQLQTYLITDWITSAFRLSFERILRAYTETDNPVYFEVFLHISTQSRKDREGAPTRRARILPHCQTLRASGKQGKNIKDRKHLRNPIEKGKEMRVG